MDDLISRQQAIDLLKQMRKDGDMVPWEGKNVFARIRELPAEPHWIPVTERLPEYGEAVLTIAQDDVYEVNHIVDDVHGEWFWEDNGKVLAWMPLPEPYKGVTE